MWKHLAILSALILLGGRGDAQAPHQSSGGAEFAEPIRGTLTLRSVGGLRYTYYFDHNALKDCVRLGPVLLAVTESGNLVRFDTDTLKTTGQVIVRGRATAIASGDGGKALVGTEKGQILEVDAATLTQRAIVATRGRIAWLASALPAGGRAQIVVAALDNSVLVTPWPGEPFRHLDARRKRLQRRGGRPYSIEVYANGKRQSFVLPDNILDLPNTYLLEGSTRLWMGLDKGEWGGEIAWMDLHNGKVRKMQVPWGILGFVRAGDGRLLVFGGMSHLGFYSGFVGGFENDQVQVISKVERDSWHPSKDQASPKEISKDTPQGPIDLMAEDGERRGFWVVSEHTLYYAGAAFSHWSKVAELGGRWEGGRKYSVGNTPTTNRLLVEESPRHSVIVAMGRDGLERVSEGRVQAAASIGELESSVVDVLETPAGTVFFGDSEAHPAWRLVGGRWERWRLFPKRKPSSEYGVWDFAEPLGYEGEEVIAVCGDNILPGERSLVRVGGEDRVEELDTWTDDSSPWSDSFLRTATGGLVKISGEELWLRASGGWRKVGSSSVSSDYERVQLLRGRHNIFLARAGQTEFFFDAAFGNVVRLTSSADDTLRLAVAKGGDVAMAGTVYDAAADGNGWFLMTTTHGLLRLHLEDGRAESIPSPSPADEIMSLCRDGEGRLWAAGDQVYVSADDGKHWEPVDLPMLSKTYSKHIRPDAASEHGVVLTMHDRGVVFLEW